MQRLIASGWVGRAGWERSAASTMAGIGNSLDGVLWSFGRQHFQAPLVPLELATPWFHGNFTAFGGGGVPSPVVASSRRRLTPPKGRFSPVLVKPVRRPHMGASPPPEGFHVPPAPCPLHSCLPHRGGRAACRRRCLPAGCAGR